MSQHTPSAPATPVPHPWGVFRDEHPLDGHVVLDVYTACGHDATHAIINERWFDPAMEDELWASLRRRCAPGGCTRCPFGRSHLRAV
jgi:hypothetical protein